MEPATQLGRYRIEAFLGKGAYAEVYRAMDTALERTVALKVLKPALLADEEALSRFLQEAKTLANLVHPHIAWVWDVGEAEGRQFIAMRYVDGISLDKVLAQRGPLPWEEAFFITRQVAEALQFAHDKGLVHRDVKPQNILVSESEGAVLTDFGLVKAMTSSGITTTGSFLGTPHYMAQEIWKGEPAGPAADQYALACVLVEMLTGKVLFDALTPVAALAKHIAGPTFPEKWPKGTPSQIDNVLSRALVQKPTDRYKDLYQFIEVLVCREKGVPTADVPVEVVPEDTWIFSTSWKTEVWIKNDISGIRGHQSWTLIGRTPGDISIKDNHDVKIRLRPANESELAGMLDEIASEKRITFVELNLLSETANDWLEHLSVMNNLQGLYLSEYKQLSNSGLEHLGFLITLRNLDISYCPKITDLGLKHLHYLINLQSLNLCGCARITDAGLTHLKSIVKLQELDLGECKQITDLGLENLNSLANLQSLDLAWCNQITDNGLKHLRSLTNLQRLKLDFCWQITDDGLAHLRSLKNLQFLHLYKCNKVTDDGLSVLQKRGVDILH